MVQVEDYPQLVGTWVNSSYLEFQIFLAMWARAAALCTNKVFRDREEKELISVNLSRKWKGQDSKFWQTWKLAITN